MQELEEWGKFHDYWMVNKHNMPVFVVRYEDLLSHTKQTLKNIFSFLLDVDDIIENMKVYELIQNAIAS